MKLTKTLLLCLPIALSISLSISKPTLAESGMEHAVYFENVSWEKAGDGVEETILWGSEENNNAVWAFRMQPGVEFPLHGHTYSYHGVAIQGTWVHIDDKGNEIAIGQEGFAFIQAGNFHGDRCEGPEVCITLIDLDGPRDLVFPKK